MLHLRYNSQLIPVLYSCASAKFQWIHLWNSGYSPLDFPGDLEGPVEMLAATAVSDFQVLLHYARIGNCLQFDSSQHLNGKVK